MQVIVALENVIKTFTFPDDTRVQFKCPSNDFITIMDGNKHSWFNMAYVIAIVPGTKAGG